MVCSPSFPQSVICVALFQVQYIVTQIPVKQLYSYSVIQLHSPTGTQSQSQVVLLAYLSNSYFRATHFSTFDLITDFEEDNCKSADRLFHFLGPKYARHFF